jgi:hypothetical protein
MPILIISLVEESQLLPWAINLGKKVATAERSTYAGLKISLYSDVIAELSQNKSFLTNKTKQARL